MPGIRIGASPAAEGVRHQPARSILSKTSGYLVDAGFTHSLTPARNCTFGCTYCYVPTMRFYGGLQPEDWQRWGQFTTFKSNAPALLARQLKPDQVIYCSPLVDPYQPAEEAEEMMLAILNAVMERPPAVFVIQTRGPLILRDKEQLIALSRRTTLRVSFSVTTNRDDVRRVYEPLCAPIRERLTVIRDLNDAGIETYATMAPILPCDPEELAARAIEATGRDLIGDPLHIRATKRFGATTREAAERIAAKHGHQAWFTPEYQEEIVSRIRHAAEARGFGFTVGPPGFGLLTRSNETHK